MKILIVCLSLTSIMAQEQMVYDFKKEAPHHDWRIVNDGVMGGVSKSDIMRSASGNGLFKGYVSLENNGGFASVRYEKSIKNVQGYQYVKLRVKGKPSIYQFRLKKNKREEVHSYVQEFDVTSEWQTVRLKLSDFYPRFRGRSLNLPNFNADKIEEVAILIGNKRKEEFELEIDSIYLSN